MVQHITAIITLSYGCLIVFLPQESVSPLRTETWIQTLTTVAGAGLASEDVFGVKIKGTSAYLPQP